MADVMKHKPQNSSPPDPNPTQGTQSSHGLWRGPPMGDHPEDGAWS